MWLRGSDATVEDIVAQSQAQFQSQIASGAFESFEPAFNVEDLQGVTMENLWYPPDNSPQDRRGY
jgi:hypothetical protein